MIALIDGEHQPALVRAALDELEAERGLAAVVFCGGEEKVRPEVLADMAGHYGRPVLAGAPPAELLGRAAADVAAGADGAAGGLAVVDLADEPVLPPAARLRLAGHALHLGLSYEAPGLRLDPPRYERVETAARKVAVIGTGKRTGKTAVAGHLGSLLRERGGSPVIVSMGRGGPAEPQLAGAGTSLDDLLRLARGGRHAASDYLEDAVLAGVPAVGCRRVGGGPAGEPRESNVADGVRLAATLDPDTIVLEGSGSCVPPVVADATVCVVGDRAGALEGLGPYRLMRARLALVMDPDPALAADVEAICPGAVLRCELRPEPASPLPPGARVALFTTRADACDGVEPVVASDALARRAELAADLDRAAAAGCDVYLTELKAASIDTVAERAALEGAEIVFVRNRPVALDGDLDRALVELCGDG